MEDSENALDKSKDYEVYQGESESPLEEDLEMLNEKEFQNTILEAMAALKEFKEEYPNEP